MTHSSIQNRKSAITKSLLSWYRKNARPLPWRKTRNPYRILVSEVMLQQTQVSRVLQKYPEFLRLFPNFSSLAHARTADVIRAWAGMGYNNRAVRLQQTAKEIMNDNNGRLPSDIHILQKLPGIGRYTAHAVACFSFGQHTAVVDTNVRRDLFRLFPKLFHSTDEWELAESMLPKRKAYEWNQALMELGSTLCTAANPRCVNCPLEGHCPSAFQIRKPKKSYNRKNHRALIPNRIYRGRIVALLRIMSRRQSIESNRLYHMIRPEARSQNQKWFSLILSGLQRDGLIQIHSQKAKRFVSMPK
jgi:A/G-specific adenine glycosylase